ncbi:MAG: YybH family protein [Gemmatimonadota bacterium]
MVRSWKTMGMCSVLVLALTACQQQATEQSGATEEEIPAGATLEATIEESNTAFEQAMLAGEPAAMTADYATDAVVQPPYMPASTGKAAIEGLFAQMVAEGVPSSFDITSENVTVAESGELAYETGHYTASGTAPDGEIWEDQGKYLSVWEKNAEGQWQTVALSWSPNAAPTGMEQAEGAEPKTEPGATPLGGDETNPAEPAAPPEGETN